MFNEEEKKVEVNLPKISTLKWVMIICSALTLIGLVKVFENTSPSKTYTIQSYFGGAPRTILGGGFKFLGLSQVLPITKEINIHTVVPSKYDKKTKSKDNNYYFRANGYSFVDKIGVWLASTTTIVADPSSENYTTTVVNKRNEDVIITSAILPLINDIHGNITKLFTTEDWIGGAKAVATEMFYDQLLNGPYMIIENPDYKSIQQKATLETADSIKISNADYLKQYVIKTDKDGNYMRSNRPGLKSYGYVLSNAAITDEEHHQDFEDALKTTRDIQAQIQEDKQKIEKQITRQKLNEETGEANKIAAQKEKEQEEIAKVIAARTSIQEKENLLKAAELETRIAEEKAKQNKLLQNSGLDPLVELQERLKNRVDVANAIFGGKALHGITTYAPGGSGSGGNSMDRLIDIAVLGIAEDINKKK